MEEVECTTPTNTEPIRLQSVLLGQNISLCGLMGGDSQCFFSLSIPIVEVDKLTAQRQPDGQSTYIQPTKAHIYTSIPSTEPPNIITKTPFSSKIATMQFTAILLATVLAATTLASPLAAEPDKIVPSTKPVPKVLKVRQSPLHHSKIIKPNQYPQAHCNGKDNDCCFNNFDGCRNQHGSIETCTLHPSLCSNFKTDAAHGAHVPSCNGADCCVITTGLGGSCHR